MFIFCVGLEAIRMDEMVTDVCKWKSTHEASTDNAHSLLLIEGFIIFNDRYVKKWRNAKLQQKPLPADKI